MQEISSHIFIENGYPGVTLAAIPCQRGMLLIDAPLRPEDIRSWRAALAARSGGYERMLLTLDEHLDRTLGARQMDCMVAGQERMNQVFKDRPVSFKSQGPETGAEWELLNNLGIVRWSPPDITFSVSLNLYWDKFPIYLRSVPGPSYCSLWVDLPEQKIIFVGDTVIPDAPPFLAHADLPAWQEALANLLSPAYRDYTIISGRSGVIAHNEVKSQSKFLGKVEEYLEKLAGKENDPHEIEHACQQLLRAFDRHAPNYGLYYTRMVYGLQQYIKGHSSPAI
jgi:hypothetical protein